MPDRVNIFLPSLPHCPTCEAEAHVLTFRPAGDSAETGILTEFAWRCPNEHVFAAAMPDIPLPPWRRTTIEDLELAELPGRLADQLEPPDD